MIRLSSTKPLCSSRLRLEQRAEVENRHIVLFGHLVDGGEQRRKVLLRIAVHLTVSEQQDVLAFSRPRRT